MKALVVDGYNAIYRIPQLKKLMDKGLSRARRAITELARSYQRRCGGIGIVKVVFDGRDEFRDKSHIAKSKEEIFSKTGCGDREIIRVVRDLSGTYDVIVASDDNFVRNNSRAQKATMISIAEFAAMAREKKIIKKDTPTKRIDIDDALEIDKELRRHWKL